MKKIFLLSGFALSFLLFCCQADDSSNEPILDPVLFGAWNISTTAINNVNESLDNCQINSSIVFEQNGSMVINDYENNLNNECIFTALRGAWEIDENKVVISPDTNATPFKATYTVQNNNTLFLEILSEGNLITTKYIR